MTFEPQYKTLVDILEHSTAAYAGRELFGTKTGGRWVWTTCHPREGKSNWTPFPKRLDWQRRRSNSRYCYP